MAVIGILIVLAFWILFVAIACMLIALYKKGTPIEGVVVENLGYVKYSTGHSSFGVPKFRTFYQYRIAVDIDGVKQEVDAELAKRRLKKGDRIKVRYIITDDNEENISSTARIHWALEMALGYTLGIIFGITLWILSERGII